MSFTNAEIKRTRGGSYTFRYTQVAGFTDDMSTWTFMFELVKSVSGKCDEEIQVFKLEDQARFTEISDPTDLQWQLTRLEQLGTPILKGTYTWRLWRTDAGLEQPLATGPLILQ
jgi:hypothetical protein